MYEYALFLIRKEYYELYKNKPDFLFEILLDLKNMKEGFSYGITMYEQLCQHIQVETVKYYLNTKYKMDSERLFYIDHHSVLLQPSRITIRSREKYPPLLRVFYCYNPYLFVCDFHHQECFWLSDFIKTNIKIKV